MAEYILKKNIENNRAKIKVFSPALSEEERKKRMQRIYKAAEAILKGENKGV